MRYFLLLTASLFVSKEGWAQCPYSAELFSLTGHCLGGDLNFSSPSTFSKIIWYKDGVAVDSSVVDPSFNLQSHLLAAGGFGIGNAANQLNSPTQIAVDSARNVYILDGRNFRVQKWPPGAATGITVAGGNGTGTAANQFDFPFSLTVDRQGNVYVGESGVNRVSKWAPGASQGVTVAGGNGAGSASNQFYGPDAIFVDCQGNLYIDDVGNNRIQLWKPGATSGITLVANDGIDVTNDLTGMGMDAAGNLYVLDPGNQRVLKWTPGATTMTTVAGGNGPGSADNQLSAPDAIYVDLAGDLYISDSYNQRIMYWAAGATTGKILYDVASANGQNIQDMAGISVDADGSVYVSDLANGWVEVYNRLSLISKMSYTPTGPGTYTAIGTDVNGGIEITPPYIIRDGNSSAATTVRISPSDTAICTGQPISFTAIPSDTTGVLIYQWQINGKAVGSDTTVFTSNALPDGAAIDCLLTTPGSCGPVSSDTTIVQVDPYPQINSPESYSVPAGQPITLHTTATGDDLSYAWSPSTGLSDTTLSDPVARLNNSIDYTLTVTGKGGCSVSGTVEVDVITPLRLPSAFTPNGDGHNDVFYVLQASQGSRIEEFAVFDRWGQRVFQVHDGMPGDRTAGWDGRVNGKEGPAGVYVYEILLQLSDGHRQSYQGTVVLVR